MKAAIRLTSLPYVKRRSTRNGVDPEFPSSIDLGKLDGKKIHLIISDVNMPNMDGITFLKAAKQLPAYKFTPVIMQTTESQESKKAEGKAAGARAWITKPFQPSTLVDAVNKLCV